MSTALYRRYRPETFADVIGQEHVTDPLMQALRSGRVNHAYLFSGPRGCGKTTSARILARCLNCEQGPTPEPCGECESCVALARGGPGSVDVIEIDAASHGGVDDARDLRERAAFGPAQSRYKVYIIDEAHMVTSHGFNALLKVVEEPPEHVKFIFATTEPDKVLSTIRSRTHHYPFHLVPPQRLTGYLEELCAAEGVQLEPGVLSFVTRAGGGSVRDSLSVLDQLISGADDRGLTYDGAAALLGFTDVELLDSVVDAVGAQDAAAVFRQVDRVMESGHDPRRFVEDLLERYRDLIVVAAVGERAGGLLRGMPEDQVERLRQQASLYGPSTLTRCADVVSRGLSEMTGAVSYRLHLELICARLLLPAAAGEDGYAARLDRIERRLAAGPGGAPAQQPSRATAPQAPARPPEPEPQAQQPEPQSRPEMPSRPEPQPQPQQQPQPQSEPRPETAVEQVQPPVEEPQPPAEFSPPAPAVPEQPAVPVTQTQAPVEPPQPEETPAPGSAPGSLDTEAVRRSWPEILDKVKEIRRVTWTLVSVNSTVLDYDGRRVLLGLSSAGLATTFNQGVHAEVVRQGLIDAIGLDARVEGTASPQGGGGPGGGSPASGGGNYGGGQGSGPTPGGPSRGNDPAPVQAGPGAPSGPGPQAASPREPSAAEQLGVAGVASSAPSRAASAGAPPAQEWAESAREAPPAWVTEAPVEAPAPAPTSPEPSRTAPNPVPPAPEPAPEPVRRPGGDVPREDDEDLESSGAVGLPVIESVLGGTVISVDDDPTH
ncbi:DNA polymerase III subunit gamma and tau [Ornithinimicrobium faecis]|uniref:DNA polymerase III subunit gamma/tau n=1 Tax=Ornithinimicrobium faecis TaxID=2934158 RepID=A0ABY4YSC3_9MICO|nr:DNA polymerase III subunit gamma and tau [Ornithinimicrobium sp. HY1793]USQ79661.1 DNA polymerase III subunit gamma and tau [Ornithinimicrobium sp. HY1793]